LASRRDGSRLALQRPSPCTPISSTSSPLAPEASPSGDYPAESERHEQRRTPSVRPRQNGKPHSAVHADRGFLHGWLCDAKRHPKPFTIAAVDEKPQRSQERTHISGSEYSTLTKR